jgi:5-hydroxyisourate hydrolase-like protein (transthyretin family)
MSKFARPVVVTAVCLAAIGLGTSGVAVAAGESSPSASQTTVQGSEFLRPTSIPLKATKSTVAPNQKVTLRGFLKSGHTPVAAVPVTLEKRTARTKTFTVVSTKLTDSNGKVTLVVTPGKSKAKKVQYKLVFAGNATYRGSHSQIITLTVS